MSVELSPQELGFRRPFNHEVTQVLRLANNNAGTVAFKVKTTAPKQYCVRPNSGVIKANDSVDVQVLLQAMKEDPPLDARCRDKFLVQSVLVDDSEESNVATLWSNVEKTNKGSIQEQKIRVQFLPPGGSTHLNGGVTSDEPPAYSSPTPAYGSPAPASSSDAKSPSVAESARSTASHATEATTTGASSAYSSVTNAIPKNQDDVNQQLSAAQARIKDLTNQLSDPQVRQRKVAETQEKVQQVVQQTQDTGVPLHIVAALCLLSFLIAYVFF
ncbi:phosphatidylinositol-binding protein scs2 [Knufia obscura]|uniref:Phosphatidylinositol-binding protein scs2 n=2 Tax=Knufia TaxID=430999 RepID=A0AAN8EPU6_9EURO|nr:phosphatidylinositol-binding protein scs2 [Knufia obscura]KAK5955887.1 phosphatidylinositol-binding protein scs2 [Knufia fluminis]